MSDQITITEKLARDLAKRAAWMIQDLKNSNLWSEERLILEANLHLILDWNQKGTSLTQMIHKTMKEIIRILEGSKDQRIRNQMILVYWLWTDHLISEQPLEEEQ
jgi:hypothetical protein